MYEFTWGIWIVGDPKRTRWPSFTPYDHHLSAIFQIWPWTNVMRWIWGIQDYMLCPTWTTTSSTSSLFPFSLSMPFLFWSHCWLGLGPPFIDEPNNIFPHSSPPLQLLRTPTLKKQSYDAIITPPQPFKPNMNCILIRVLLPYLYIGHISNKGCILLDGLDNIYIYIWKFVRLIIY